MGGNGDGTVGLEIDLKRDMLLGSLDTDGPLIDEPEILDVPLFFYELSEFGESGVVENGEGSAFFAGLIVDSDVNVMTFHMIFLP